MDLKLLIADDERLDREGLARQLNWNDYSISQVFTAKDGLAALEILNQNHIDILLSDIQMPLMSGFDLLQRARAIQPNLKIVLVSGHDDFAFAKKAISLGVQEYILKPVRTEELIIIIKNLVDMIIKEAGNNHAEIDRNADHLMPSLSELKSSTEIQFIQSKEKSVNERLVNKIIVYVEEHYASNITLEKIAQDLWYTPNYLGTIFKQETKMNFSKYLMEYRIRQAAKLLQDHKLKILEVSILTGYNNIPTFIKNFKSVYGVTPSEYRKYL